MVDCLDLDPTGMSRGELSQQLLDIEALRSRLDAAAMWATQVWDAQQVWVDDGARTGAAWLRHHAGMSSRRASAQLRTARDLRSMPCTAAAFEHGDLTVEKVQLLAWARTDATAGLFDQFEQTLVDAARTCVYDDLVKAVRHWKAGAESLGFANDPDAMVHGRHASVSETLDGAVKVDGWLGPESGQVFKRVFDAIDRELARQERRDRDNAVGAPARTAPQRHADALTEMARRAAASDPDTARRARPEVIVHLDWATLVAEAGGVGHFANGCPVSGEAARRLACDAGIARVITNGPSEILDLGRRTPVPSTPLRRALAMRDGGCVFAGCDMPPECCDAHHFVAYGRGRDTGGPTDMFNLGLLCPRHHHLVHEGGFSVGRNPVTGVIESRRPDGSLIPDPPRITPLTLFGTHPWRVRHPRADDPSPPGGGEVRRSTAAASRTPSDAGSGPEGSSTDAEPADDPGVAERSAVDGRSSVLRCSAGACCESDAPCCPEGSSTDAEPADGPDDAERSAADDPSFVRDVPGRRSDRQAWQGREGWRREGERTGRRRPDRRNGVDRRTDPHRSTAADRRQPEDR